MLRTKEGSSSSREPPGVQQGDLVAWQQPPSLRMQRFQRFTRAVCSMKPSEIRDDSTITLSLQAKIYRERSSAHTILTTMEPFLYSQRCRVFDAVDVAVALWRAAARPETLGPSLLQTTTGAEARRSAERSSRRSRFAVRAEGVEARGAQDGLRDAIPGGITLRGARWQGT